MCCCERSRRAAASFCLSPACLRRCLSTSGRALGVRPPVNAALATTVPYRRYLGGIDVQVVHGAGHAGKSALAKAWLTGALADLDDDYRRDIDGLRG